jgi:hypothetical protein
VTRLRIFVALSLIFMLLSVTACGCLGGGSGSKQTVETKTTTLGQELTDLQKAHESGAITDEQYQKAKKELLKKYNAE